MLAAVLPCGLVAAHAQDAGDLAELERTYAPRVAELDRMLRAGRETDRQVAIAELGRIGLAALRPLTALIADARWDVRQAAALALGQVALDPVGPALCELLRDRNWAVRAAAAEGLGRLSGVAVRDALSARLDDAVWRVQVAAVLALGRQREPVALPRVLALADAQEPDVRAAAIEVLAGYDHPDALRRLEPVLADRDPVLRALAFRALRGAGDRVETARLVPLLSDADAELRADALALLLPRLGEDHAAVTPVLDALVTDLAGEPMRRSAAESTLARVAKSAHGALLRALRHPDPVVRARVVAFVQVDIRPGDAAELIAAYEGVRPEDRPEFVRAIGAIEPLSTEFLLQVARADGGSERLIAIEALRRANAASPAVETALVALLDDPEWQLRRGAADSLFALGLRPIAAALTRLRGETQAQVLPALLSLVVSGGDESVTAELIALYEHREDPQGRTLLARAIGLRPDRAAEAWVRRRLGDADESVRGAAIAATRERPAAFRDELLHVARKDASPPLRTAALQALAGLRDPLVLDALLAALQDESVEVRDRAVHALPAQGDARAVAPLLALLTSPRAGPEILRLAAMDALVRFTDEQIVPALTRVATRDDSELMRSHAVMLLSSSRDPDVALQLTALARRETSPFVKRQLCYALGMIGDPTSLPALRHLAEDEDAGIRATALLSIGLFPPPLPLDFLRERHRDPSPEVRLAVLDVLGSRAAADSREVIFERLTDEDERVRRRALTALAVFPDAAAAQAALAAALKDTAIAALAGEQRWFEAGQFLLGYDLAGAAQSAFETVLATDPADSPYDVAARFHLGTLELHQGRFTEAIPHLEAAIAGAAQAGPTLGLAPERLRGWGCVARGLAALTQGREEFARREFADADTLTGGDAQVLNTLAWILVERNLAVEIALKYGRRALAAMPAEPAIQDTVAWIEYRLGHQREALALLEQALQRRPEDPEILLHHAQVLMHNGRRQAAFDALVRAVRSDPGIAAQAEAAPEFRSVRTNEDFRAIVRPGPKFAPGE